ncbi:glucose/arabinose dehydrogenase [Halopolyspora algeriensis]|uniref:Glucose/arabinose dehydrogenase n=1 Tax=Halopolyspora algeriensis TaxID=1500506 RepID=A0A368VFM9_9ACTN|nr:PQQ-dependent sugar dehydrogenase [Halopolyspora algeriensis]RCW39960.1 glucose/arabinose dehydrogenase [Halopolyspora algeriensis]TQM46603.1 glucose/arabinose dehydrogenase [Halopolyspora algeriensis]
MATRHVLSRRRALAGLSGLLLLPGCSGNGEQQRGPQPTPSRPGLRVEVLADGLEHPWDIGFLPDGSALITQRPGRLALLSGGRMRPVRADFGDVLARGEGGLMGLLVHPEFATNRRFLTCQTHRAGGRAVDVRLVTWELSGDGTRARRVGPLLTGLPVNPSGRHSGCRPALAADGSLLVTTGDSARPAVAQDLSSLGGKVLRMDLDTGAPLPGNPFLDSPDPATRLVLTYGHRNPQGIAVRGSGQVLIAEHGPDVDDEINLLRPGGNYGWDPSRGGTQEYYDESVPMTDRQRFPDAVPAVWSSGGETEAVCDATFLTGSHWSPLDGVLAVTALKGSKVLLFRLSEDGRRVRSASVPGELDGTHGRLRAATQGPDGALYVSTSNGTDDRILRVSPA